MLLIGFYIYLSIYLRNNSIYFDKCLIGEHNI